MNYVVHEDTDVKCPHGGGVEHVRMIPRLFAFNVRIVHFSVMTEDDLYPIVCPVCPSKPPCVMVRWRVTTRRVTVRGSKVLLIDDFGECMPNGVDKIVTRFQTRVKAT